MAAADYDLDVSPARDGPFLGLCAKPHATAPRRYDSTCKAGESGNSEEQAETGGSGQTAT